MNEDFKIMIASDPEHEEVYAEIYFDGKFVALVSQEAGRDREEVEFPGMGLDESVILRRVPLHSFQEALGAAARRLEGET